MKLGEVIHRFLGRESTWAQHRFQPLQVRKAGKIPEEDLRVDAVPHYLGL